MTYQESYDSIVRHYSKGELLQIGRVLNKNYNIYDPEEAHWRQISYALFKTKAPEIEELRAYCFSNRFINDFLLDYYVCERVVKYYFIKSMLHLSDHIVAFEMSIGDSRIDICRINGTSYAYEIKTEYDTFDRLKTQMSDYSKSFEKVYIIVPRSRAADAMQHIPDNCGVIAYRMNNASSMVFSYIRKSKKNCCDPNACIESLSSNDMSALMKILKIQDANSREKKECLLKEYASRGKIWPAYKQVLKNRYASHWSFLKEHFNEILPIDVQNFFMTTANPALLYSPQNLLNK